MSVWIGVDRWIVHVTHLVKSVQKRDLLHLRKVTTVVTKGGAVSRESGVTQRYFGTTISLRKIANVCCALIFVAVI